MSDRFLEAIGIFNLRMLKDEEQNALLDAVDQAASLLKSKDLFKIEENKVTLTDRGVKYRELSPLYLWREAAVSDRAGQFLGEAAARLLIVGPDDLFVLKGSGGMVRVSDLFAELGWDYSDGRWKQLKAELLRYFLIEPVHSMGEIEIRITERGMLFASYID